MNPVLSVQGLTVSFTATEKPAVEHLSFDLFKGETLALVGESGSGKSVTSLAIMGLLPNNAVVQGKIFLADHKGQLVVLQDTNNTNWRGQHIAMVFQEPMSALNPIMNVGTQLEECFDIEDKERRKQLVIEWFKKVQLPNPEEIGNRYPHQLSGGQKQRVMIAMAMCNHPQVLIADEPTTALDASIQEEVLALMKTLQKETGTALIFITHDLVIAKKMADKVVVMRKGEVVEQSSSQNLFTNPQHGYTKALLKTRPSPKLKGYKLPVVADFLSNESFEPILASLPNYDIGMEREILLRVKNLSVRFPAKKNWIGRVTIWNNVLHNVSFDMFKGESLGLVGESGSGKSTIGKVLVGLLKPNTGEVLYRGQSLDSINEHASSRPIQMVFQDAFASLNPRISVKSMLRETLMHLGLQDDTAISKKIDSLLDLTGLPANSINKYPHEFSGGQRQRLGISRALAMNPELLICDESVSALDVSVQAQILNLLNELKKELQLSYLFISHDQNVVQYFCDRVIFLEKGTIVSVSDEEIET